MNLARFIRRHYEKTVNCRIFLCCVALTGCVSKAEFDELEARVSVLEQNSSANTQNQTDYNQTTVESTIEQTEQSSDLHQTTLSIYIKNWDEVITILEQEYNRNDFTITENTESRGYSSIKNFGNGNYEIYVDGTRFLITVRDYIAQQLQYDDGYDKQYIQTPSYTPDPAFAVDNTDPVT